MKTPNTLHVTLCHVCRETAVVTVPTPGDQPKGYCYEHLIEYEQEGLVAQQTAKLMDAVFASLGVSSSNTLAH